MTNCPFCEIDKTERIIRRSQHSLVFLSNPRLMPGHTLIIPKRHIEKPWELTTEELLDIFNNIWWAEHKLLKGGIATGCDIRQNYRPFMPQGRVKVNHLHFHVMPRTLEDKLYQESMRFERDLFKDLPEDEREQVVKLFA